MRSRRLEASEERDIRTPSLVERMDALRRANEVRTRRSELKRALKAGEADISSVLRDPPEWLSTAKVIDLLLAVPRVGRVRASKTLAEARLSPSKTVGALTTPQRRALLTLLEPTRAGRDHPWRRELTALLDRAEVLTLLALDVGDLEEMTEKQGMIVLVGTDGHEYFPAFQFQGGRPAKALVRAHSALVEQGRLSPWSASSWAVTGHPELGGKSPAEWVADGEDEKQLLDIARRDAAQLAR